MVRKLKEKVEAILIEWPVTRDNDHQLVCMIWIKELGGKSNVKAMSAWDFLAIFNNHKIFNYLNWSFLHRGIWGG